MLNIYIIDRFNFIFLQSFKSWFIINKNILDIKYIYHYIYIVITLNKKFQFFWLTLA